jgi:hypothetical protein
VYEKPALYIERFMLTQSIASGCSPSYPDFGMPNQASQETCGWDVFPGFEIFTNLDICDYPGEAFEFVCYNAPDGGGFIAFAAS